MSIVKTEPKIKVRTKDAKSLYLTTELSHNIKNQITERIIEDHSNISHMVVGDVNFSKERMYYNFIYQMV